MTDSTAESTEESRPNGQTNGQTNGAGHSRRDDELEALRAEIAKLNLELKTTTAERDYLQHASLIHSERSEQFRKPSVSQPRNPDAGQQLGQSRASLTEDPRIGRPRRILIIGGGPAGLITLHEFLNPLNRPEGASLHDYQIQLYERRGEVGGVWYFEPDNDIAKGWHHGAEGLQSSSGSVEAPKHKYAWNGDSAGDVELLDMTRIATETSNGKPSSEESNGHRDQGLSREDSQGYCYIDKPHAPRWPSPAYEGLVGNVLPPLLEFSAKSFPKLSGGLFPSMVETHEYLLSLAAPVRSHIKTSQEVTSVRPVYRNGNLNEAPTWVVTSTDWSDEAAGAERTEEYDAVITAAGAFDSPYFPDTPGLAPLLKSKSRLIMHAKTYPGPRPFLNQANKVVVVGNANSANDIAAHLAPLNSTGPLYRCVRHESRFAHLPDPRIKDVAPIISIEENKSSNTLNLTLEDGTKLDGITKLIFASGYEYRFGWISVPSLNDNPQNPETPHSPRLEPASKYGAVPNLHNGTFVATAPTIAFIGLAAGSTPMPLAEIQARVVVRTFNNLLRLPAPDPHGLLADFHVRAKELELRDDSPDNWRTLHMVRGPEERRLTAALLDFLEQGEPGSSEGLFRWDERREGIVKNMRVVKEGELRRLRDARIAAGGVDGGVGGLLATNTLSPAAPSSEPPFQRGMSASL